MNLSGGNYSKESGLAQQAVSFVVPDPAYSVPERLLQDIPALRTVLTEGLKTAIDYLKNQRFLEALPILIALKGKFCNQYYEALVTNNLGFVQQHLGFDKLAIRSFYLAARLWPPMTEAALNGLKISQGYGHIKLIERFDRLYKESINIKLSKLISAKAA